jgi:hypothetical protein
MYSCRNILWSNIIAFQKVLVHLKYTRNILWLNIISLSIDSPLNAIKILYNLQRFQFNGL